MDDADSLQRFIGKEIRPGSPLAAGGLRYLRADAGLNLAGIFS